MLAERDNYRPEWLLLGVLVVINLAAKAAFIGINTGEYTDGILQLTVMDNKAGLYPPLYGWLAGAVSMLGVDLEMAGRIISVVAGAMCVGPVYWLGLRLGGPGSARLAALLYTVSPMPWRWSVRVMTDSLYLLLSTLALCLLLEAWSRSRRPDESLPQKRKIAGFLGLAAFVGAMAVLTRYQGVLLAPLIALVGIVYVRRFRAVPWLAIGPALAWIGLPIWMMTNGFVHQDQFASRTAQTMTSTLSAWWNTFESFILISPYYIGYPLVIAAIGAFFIIRSTTQLWYARPAAWLWGFYALMLLGLHAAFGSFQYRYMMPLLPMAAALAGAGFHWMERRWSERRRIFSAALLLSLSYLVIFSLAVLVFQREAFGDQREAARFIRSNVPPTTPVYANERYGNFTNLGSVKLSFWSGRKVEIVGQKPMEPGSVLALGTAYGGDEAVKQTMAVLSQEYTLRPLTPQPFRSSLIPLMDDIMVNPLFNQNPMGWIMRYVPQPFATQLFEVQPLAGGAALNGR